MKIRVNVILCERNLVIFILIFWFSSITTGVVENFQNGNHTCAPLALFRNIDITCIYGGVSSECTRSQPIGTIAKYKCKQNHIPFDSSTDKYLGVQNKLRCDVVDGWTGLKQYESYRCKEDCGKLTKNAKPLVINGVALNQTLWPWHATIYQRLENTWSYICGGSIIRNQIVISAAHCFALDHNRVKNTDEFRIILGSVSSSYLENMGDGRTQVYKVERIYVSENYDPLKGYQSDIAVIQLRENIVFNENIVPVCLPNDYNADINVVKAGMVGKVAGFGITEDGKVSPVLKSLDLSIKSNAECYSSLQRVLSESQFCGGGKDGHKWATLCNGDSGGGLCFSSNVHQKYYIHGIVSSGDPDTDNGVCKNYAVFTRIYTFIFWIRDVIEEISGEIARDLRQNLPYPYAVRGTETQMTSFTGLPREWVNRVTSLEIVYATVNSEIMLDALENAKPIDTINLKSVVFLENVFKRHVVLPVLSYFSLDILTMDSAFENLTLERNFPVSINENYFKSLLFFDKDFETGDNWRVETIITLNTDIELGVHIFKILRIHTENGELMLQQTKLGNRILDSHTLNLDFTLRNLALHLCEIDFFKLGQFFTLTDLILNEVNLSPQISHQVFSSIFKNLTSLKVLVWNPLQLGNEKITFNLEHLAKNIIHLSTSTSLKIENTHHVIFPHLATFCCINCVVDENVQTKFQKFFPNVVSIVIKSTQNINSILFPFESPTLTFIYIELKQIKEFINRLSSLTSVTISQNVQISNSDYILLERNIHSNNWTVRIPTFRERHHLFYTCNHQSRFWTSEEDYLTLRRLKSFEKMALNSNTYNFKGTSSPNGLEEFTGIPPSIQRHLTSIHLTSIDVTPQILTDSIAHVSNLKLLTLTKSILDISSHKYQYISNQSIEFKLERFEFKEFTFYYVLEFVDKKLTAGVIPYQHIGRFKSNNSTNVLHRLFQNINAVRLTNDDCVVYMLDTLLLEVRRFNEFLVKVLSTLPNGHPLKGMSAAFIERHNTFRDGVLPPSWKFSGLHVINQDFVKTFFKDDVLRFIGNTGILDLLLTRLGKFVTIERSTSLSFLKKEQNPLNFPVIHAISVNLNEDKIE